MSVLAPTPPERMIDAKGRPYFLWDEDITLDVFRSRLADPDPEVRAYYLGKLMRQAKPDDVFTFATLRDIVELFPLLVRYPAAARFRSVRRDALGKLLDLRSGPVEVVPGCDRSGP